VLQAAVKGAKDTADVLSFLMEELRNVMFLVGAEKVEQMAKVPVVVTGKTAGWLETRGFNIENYARRGAR
jgi:isopentenyl-diphosphate delta-isomerase